MKKINIILSVFLIVSFSACRFQLKDKISIDNNEIIPEEKIELSPEESYITVNLLDGYNSGRTALPSFEWNDFEYTLSAYINGSSELTTLVSQKPYTAFNEQKLTIKKAKYNFVLTGYMTSNEASAVSVIQGVSDEIDLNEGAKEVVFRMYALSGDDLYGKAEITITLPNDGVIKTIKACVKNSRSVSEGDLVDLTSSLDAATNTLVYKPENIPAGKTQYALFYFYDENGGCITNLVESLIIVAGKTSYSSRTISANNYHRYDVSVKFIIEKEDGTIEGVFNTKTLTVRGEDGKDYILVQQSDGSYSGTLAEQKYTVIYNEKDTGVSFYSPNSTSTIEFKEVGIPTGGITLDNIKNGVVSDDGSVALVPKTDESFTANVVVKPGYSVTDGKVTVDGNSVSVGEKITVSTSKENITASGATPIEYNIYYNFDNGNDSTDGKFKTGYTAPSKYTVENYPVLPTNSNVEAPSGLFLDGWKCNGEMWANIPKGTTGDITLVVVYKDGVKLDTTTDNLTQEEKDSGAKGVIFAKGYSLIIKWKDNNPDTGYTEVYYDYDGDGDIDTEDVKIADQDFTDYVLKASDIVAENDIASDFTFNMQGGKIASLVGLGKGKNNISTVNISGNCIIGNKTTIGIDLASLTDEKVNFVGEMKGSYSITLLSEHVFDPDRNTNRVIAEVADTSYVQDKYITCLPKGEAANKTEYIQNDGTLKLSTKTVGTRSYIYLFNPNPIALPNADAQGDNGIVWESTGVGTFSDTDFTLGDSTTITDNCSVFSLSVKNGTFKIRPASDGSDPTRMYDMYGNYIGTDDLCQIRENNGTISYRALDEKKGITVVLKADEPYVYIHMFSTQNLITPEASTKFLKNIVFMKDDPNVEIEVNVNLETVPYKLEAGASGDSIEKAKKKAKAFSYYDGSFYMGIEKATDWITAYNEAKAETFNGLNGYLMTITSDVENSYIEKCMGLTMSWMGGSRIVPKNNVYDADTFVIEPKEQEYEFIGTNKDSKNETKRGNGLYYSTDFKWQCGPEAGQTFTTGKFTVTKTKSGWSTTTTYAYVPDESAPEGRYANWERKKDGYDQDEPNNYNNDPENCAQFHNDGKWNDLKYNTKQEGYAPQGYIIEFRPYERADGYKNVATAKNIKATAKY